MSLNNSINCPNISFSGYLNNADNDVTGDNSVYALGSGNALTISFNNGGGLATNGIFTAPVSAVYWLNASIGITNFTNAMTTSYMMLYVDGVPVVYESYKNPYSIGISNNTLVSQLSAPLYIAATSQVYAAIIVGTDTKTVDTYISEFACSFSGFLIL